MEKFNPGTNRVLVLPAQPESLMGKAGLIKISEWRQSPPNYGTVIGVGKLEGTYAEIPNPPKAGNYALWNPTLAKNKQLIEVELEGKIHFLLHAEHIFGILKSLPNEEKKTIYKPETTSIA